MPPPTSDGAAEDMGRELANHFDAAALVDVRIDTFDYEPPVVAVTGHRG